MLLLYNRKHCLFARKAQKNPHETSKSKINFRVVPKRGKNTEKDTNPSHREAHWRRRTPQRQRDY